jgi:salicylic acid 3-hydroxylase
VTNHGIPAEVVEGMLRVAREFFHLPESERLKYHSDDPKKAIRLSTSFNVRTEKVNNWRDFLRLHCYPLESFIDQWPSNPPSFRWVVFSLPFPLTSFAFSYKVFPSRKPGC